MRIRNLDPDPAYHFDPDPDPAYHFDADLDPDSSFRFDADPQTLFITQDRSYTRPTYTLTTSYGRCFNWGFIKKQVHTGSPLLEFELFVTFLYSLPPKSINLDCYKRIKITSY